MSDLLENVGHADSDFEAQAFVNLDCKEIECDEIWSFCYSKQRSVPDKFVGTPGYGDVRTWEIVELIDEEDGRR
jgi:hypothetical protein